MLGSECSCVCVCHGACCCCEAQFYFFTEPSSRMCLAHAAIELAIATAAVVATIIKLFRLYKRGDRQSGGWREKTEKTKRQIGTQTIDKCFGVCVYGNKTVFYWNKMLLTAAPIIRGLIIQCVFPPAVGCTYLVDSLFAAANFQVPNERRK